MNMGYKIIPKETDCADENQWREAVRVRAAEIKLGLRELAQEAMD